jgi:hypothetical protein
MPLDPHKTYSKTNAAKAMVLCTSDLDAAITRGDLKPLDLPGRKRERFSGAQLIDWLDTCARRKEAAEWVPSARIVPEKEIDWKERERAFRRNFAAKHS